MIQFQKNYKTVIPTDALIETAQDLMKGMAEHDWELIEVAFDCIVGDIEDRTIIPDGCKIIPSVSSFVAQGCESGIGSDETGADLRCKNAFLLSLIYRGGNLSPSCQKCPYQEDGSCDPEGMEIALENGGIYAMGNAEKLSELLKKLDADRKPRQKRVRRITADSLRALCVQNNWYDMGTNQEYHHLLTDLSSSKENLTMEDVNIIAEDIQKHTDEVWDINDIAFEVAAKCHSFVISEGEKS